MTKLVVICGAGATLNESKAKAEIDQPPLDSGFFAQARTKYPDEFKLIQEYFIDNYSTDPASPEFDSLEGMMSILYSDVYNPAVRGSNSANAFRSLLKLINSRIAETTNSISPDSKTTLYQIIKDALLVDGLERSDISIVTFNYDLIIEKTLFQLQKLSKIKKGGILLSFPYCYKLKQYRNSKSPHTIPQFEKHSTPTKTIEVLKLHGSLNWYSKHRSKEPSPKALLNSGRELWVTARRRIRLDMTHSQKRKMYTFPIVVPPVTNKAAILHESLTTVWQRSLEGYKRRTK